MYFDNNACVPPTDAILQDFCQGAKLGNILSGGPNAQKGVVKVNELTTILRDMFGTSGIIYTSGGSESNSTVLANYKGAHIVCGMTEHSSITEIAKEMNTSWVRPTATGHILIADILSQVRPTTALVVLHSINSETGAIQAIPDLLAKLDKRVAVHIDHVQGFMKCPYPILFDPTRNMSLSASFHKIGAPVGFGMLAINYKFRPLIGGTQNGGLRGGTINIGGVYATLRAMQNYNYEKAADLRDYFDNILAKYFMVVPYPKFMDMIAGAGRLTGRYAVIISCNNCLPHTIFMCIGRDGSIYCNKLMKDGLNDRGIIIGIGSACNTGKIDEIGSMKSSPIPDVIKNGFLRISLSCYNSKREILRLIKTLSEIS